MKKFYYLIIVTVILGLVLTGCFLSNVGQVPTTGQSGVAYLTKAIQLPDPGLVGLWHFDEGSEQTAGDATGDNDGQLGSTTGVDVNDPSWVADQWEGYALSFVGTDDYVEIANESNFDFERDDPFTLEAWVKTSSDEVLNIISKFHNALPNNGYQFIKHYSAVGNVLFFFLVNDYGGGDNRIVVTGSTNIADDLWHHVAVTYDGSGNASGVQIYVDGIAEEMNVTADTLTDSILNDLPLQISGREGSNFAFNGLIDEVRIWSSALTVDQLDDMTAPTIKITTPADGAIYLIDEVVNADWSTSDGAGTGVASEDGTVANDSPIDTATAGPKNFEVTATDYAGNEGSASVTYYVLENFVTGGGKINTPDDKKATWTFAGIVGKLEDESVVGQFQIVDHTDKKAKAYHCDSDFSSLGFVGINGADEATFIGTFSNNRNDDTDELTIIIVDNGEPGTGEDTISVTGFTGFIDLYTPIDGGNFQVEYVSP